MFYECTVGAGVTLPVKASHTDSEVLCLKLPTCGDGAPRKSVK